MLHIFKPIYQHCQLRLQCILPPTHSPPPSHLPSSHIVSAAYPTLFTPAGWAFAIWGLIFIMEGVFAVYQLLPSVRDTKVRPPPPSLPPFLPPFSTTFTQLSLPPRPPSLPPGRPKRRRAVVDPNGAAAAGLVPVLFH